MRNNQIIGYIENGIVIDHIPYGNVWKIVNILNIDQEQNGRVSIGEGYETKKTNRKKGILKIEHGKLNNHQLNLVALVAPDVTISIIENGKVKEKRKAEIPEKLEGLVYCANPNCVTNDSSEKEIPVIYYKDKKFTCHYCNHDFSRDEAKLI